MQDQPAFPHQVDDNYWPGITLRDYFAAKAMQGFISSGFGPNEIAKVVEWSFEYADAMLKVRGEA